MYGKTPVIVEMVETQNMIRYWQQILTTLSYMQPYQGCSVLCVKLPSCSVTKFQGQGCWGMIGVDEAESRFSEVGYIGSPCSRGSSYYMDEASTNGPKQDRTSYHSRQRTSRGSVAFRSRQHDHSFSWKTGRWPMACSCFVLLWTNTCIAAFTLFTIKKLPAFSESSDQNFDGEAEGSRKKGRGSSENQQKLASTAKV